jgi:drug/metabolite transporter (DMT)-like permease
MSWQLLIGLSVLLYSVNGLLHRTIMKDESSDAYAQAVMFTSLICLFFLVALSIRGEFQTSVSSYQLLLIILSSCLSAAGMVFTFQGFKLIGASEHTILLTSTQVWLIIGALLFLKENLTVLKLVGAILILSGIVLAEWRGQAFVFNRGAVYVLLAAFFFGASGTISFFIIRDFDIFSYMLYSGAVVTLVLIISKPQIFKRLSFYLQPKRAINIFLTSINDATANVFGYAAYQAGRNVLQIGPISATQTLVTVLLAIAILKERDHLVQKIIGSLAAVIGTTLLL